MKMFCSSLRENATNIMTLRRRKCYHNKKEQKFTKMEQHAIFVEKSSQKILPKIKCTEKLESIGISKVSAEVRHIVCAIQDLMLNGPNHNYHFIIPYSRKLTKHRFNSHETKTKEINANAYGNLWKRI